MSPIEHQKFTRFAPIAVMTMIALVGATFLTILTSQSHQLFRSEASSSNLLSNPGCENGTNYYKGYQASISTTTATRYSGSYSCKVVSTGGTFYDMESLQSFSNPVYGQKFSGSAWVRSDSNSGRKVYLVLRENGGGLPFRSVYGSGVTLTTSWQQVSNTITVQSSGRSSLDYYIVQDPGAAGHVFYADELMFMSGIAQQPAPTAIVLPTPTPIQSWPDPTNIPTQPYVPPTPTNFPWLPTAIPTPTSFNAPTPTPTIHIPGTSTVIKLSLLLHGIGHGGDAVSATSVGNTNPLRPQRLAEVQIYDVNNNLVADRDAVIIYEPSIGIFKSTVDLGTSIPSGAYTMRIKSDQFLRTQVPGIVSLTAGAVNQIVPVAMTNGDVNNDNKIDIIDYNLLMGCYSDLTAAVNCPAGYQTKADLNDDGAVNFYDYNLFLRELTKRGE